MNHRTKPQNKKLETPILKMLGFFLSLFKAEELMNRYDNVCRRRTDNEKFTAFMITHFSPINKIEGDF